MTRLPLLALTALLAQPAIAVAQSSVSELCGYESGAYNASALHAQIGGRWNQYANGVGFTRGQNIDPFDIVIDPTGNQLFMGIEGFQGLPLNPLAQAELAKVPVGHGNIRDAQVSFPSAEDPSKTLTMSGADMALLAGCDVTSLPRLFYFYDGGIVSAYGVYTFINANTGIGIIGNSAGGQRVVRLLR